jgi:hypothetical protein
VDTEKAVREHAAAEEGAKLLLDEVQGRLLSARGAREKAFQLLPHDPVKKRLLRLMALVLGHAVPVRDRAGEAQAQRLEPISRQRTRVILYRRELRPMQRGEHWPVRTRCRRRVVAGT